MTDPTTPPQPAPSESSGSNGPSQPPRVNRNPVLRWGLRLGTFAICLSLLFYGLYFRYGYWGLCATVGLICIGLSIPFPKLSIVLAVLFSAALVLPQHPVANIEQLIPDYREGLTPQEIRRRLSQYGNPERWENPRGLAMHEDAYNKPSPFRHPFRDLVLMYRMHDRHCNLYLFFEKDEKTGRYTMVDYYIGGRG